MDTLSLTVFLDIGLELCERQCQDFKNSFDRNSYTDKMKIYGLVTYY